MPKTLLKKGSEFPAFKREKLPTELSPFSLYKITVNSGSILIKKEAQKGGISFT